MKKISLALASEKINNLSLLNRDKISIHGFNYTGKNLIVPKKLNG